MTSAFSLVVVLAVVGCISASPYYKSKRSAEDNDVSEGLTRQQQREFNEAVVECLNETPASMLEGYDEAAEVLLNAGLDEDEIARTSKQMKAHIQKRALRMKRWDYSDEVDYTSSSEEKQRLRRSSEESYGSDSDSDEKQRLQKQALRVKRDYFSDEFEDYSSDDKQRLRRSSEESYGSDSSSEEKQRLRRSTEEYYESASSDEDDKRRVRRDDDEVSMEQIIFLHYTFQCVGEVVMQAIEEHEENSSK